MNKNTSVDELFLFLNRMNAKARSFLLSLSANDISDQNVVYRKLTFAGFYKEAYSILMMDEVDYSLMLLNVPLNKGS